MNAFVPAAPAVFLTLHMLRTHVPGNLNRDDLGDPKSCVFGGTRRLRVSSQCIKRAIRTGEVFKRFSDEARELFQADRMIRTRSLFDEAEKVFLSESLTADVAKAAAEVIAKSMRKGEIEGDESAKASKRKGKGKVKASEEEAVQKTAAPADPVQDESNTTQLAAISHAELRAVADLIKRSFATSSAQEVGKGLKNEIKNAYAGKDSQKLLKLVGRSTPEISLFGRMMANSEIFKSVESPLQMAHAFTTTAVEMDRDYWTGVDDLNEINGKAGAGMIEVRRFGAGVFYHFANLDLTQLYANLEAAFPFHDAEKIRDLTRRLVLALVDAFAMEQPSGYQTSFASLAAADVLAFGLGEGQPISAGAAFEPRLKAGGEEGEGTLEASTRALTEWVEAKRKRFGKRLVLPEFEGIDGAYDDQLAQLDARLSAILAGFGR